MIPPSYLRAKGAACYLGIGRSTFWAFVNQGRIDKGIKLSQNCTVWPVKALDEFVAKAADMPPAGGAKRGRKPRGAGQ